MASPAVSGQFGDLLLPDFRRIFHEKYDAHEDMIPTFYTMETSGKATEKVSGVSTLGDAVKFSGQITYKGVDQMYDITATHIEWALGFQVERALYDDDQYGIMNQRPRGLGRAMARTKQAQAARLFNYAFNDDTEYWDTTENVALCSNSHTTTTGASTSTGFDNLGTSALNATSLAAAKLAMEDLRGTQGERIVVSPTAIVCKPDLYEAAYELVATMGKVDTAENNANVHYGMYNLYLWNEIDDTNNWLLIDEDMMKEAVFWYQRIPVEFKQEDDFDTYIAKYGSYERYSYLVSDWRWCYGNQVS
jgi:phage major head subunit gpT-like protein